VLLVSCFSILP